MALRECAECSTRFAVGLEVCPHCGSGSHDELGASPDTTEGPPPKSAAKPVWVAYAEAAGVDSSGTKDEIIARFS